MLKAIFLSQNKVIATPARATTPATRVLAPAASGATAAAGATGPVISAFVMNATDYACKTIVLVPERPVAATLSGNKETIVLCLVAVLAVN